MKSLCNVLEGLLDADFDIDSFQVGSMSLLKTLIKLQSILFKKFKDNMTYTRYRATITGAKDIQDLLKTYAPVKKQISLLSKDQKIGRVNDISELDGKILVFFEEIPGPAFKSDDKEVIKMSYHVNVLDGRGEIKELWRLIFTINEGLNSGSVNVKKLEEPVYFKPSEQSFLMNEINSFIQSHSGSVCIVNDEFLKQYLKQAKFT